EFDAINEPPLPQIHRVRATIEQFDEFIRLILAERMVEDLVDHERANQRRGIGNSRRWLSQWTKAFCAIRISAGRNAVGLRLEGDGVDDASLRRVHQENPLPRSAQ